MGERLRLAREAAGPSQTDVADALGLKQQQISRWENGEEIPHDRHRRHLAELLKVELADLQEWIADAHEAQTKAVRRENLDLRKDLSEARAALSDAASLFGGGLAEIKRFSDTYQEFHAAYQQIGEQIDQLVGEIADIKRILRQRHQGAT